MECSVSNPMQAARAAAARQLGILENRLEENLNVEEGMFDSLQHTCQYNIADAITYSPKTGGYADAGERFPGKDVSFAVSTSPAGMSKDGRVMDGEAERARESFTLQEFAIW